MVLGIPILQDRILCQGAWFPAHSNVTCTGKGVKLDSANQRTGINSYDDFIGLLEVLTPCEQETE